FSFFFQAEDGIRDDLVTGVQTCALPICGEEGVASQDPDAEGDELPQPQIAEGDQAEADEDEEGLDMPLYSPVEVLASRDFSTFEIGRASCRERVSSEDGAR